LEQIGDLLYHKGEPCEKQKKAIRHASQSYKEAEITGLAILRTLAMLASLKDIQGEAEEGIQLCQTALALAEQARDELAQANATLNLSNIYRRTRRMGHKPWKQPKLRTQYISIIRFVNPP
jgi:hypothetical protein